MGSKLLYNERLIKFLSGFDKNYLKAALSFEVAKLNKFHILPYS